MTEPEYRYRQRVPPCKADQAQIRKLFMSVRAHMLVRAYDVDIGEQIRGAERSYKASRSTRQLLPPATTKLDRAVPENMFCARVKPGKLKLSMLAACNR